MTDDIKNFTPDAGAAKRTSRGHLWSVATGDQLGEPVTVDVAPDSMAGLDHVAMLRGDAEPGAGAADASESEAINDGAEHVSEELPTVAYAPALDGRQEPVEDLETFELPYADGSTTPAKPVKRHRLRPRQKTSPADHELEAAIAATSTDVWAAHRNDQFDSDPEPASGQPIGIPTASEGQDRSRGRRLLALVAVAAVVVVLAGASIVVFGGGGGGGKDQASRAGITGGAKAHHKTHAAGSHVGTVTVPANVTSTTSATLAARPKHTAKQKTRKRTVSDSTVTTSTVASTPVVTSTSKVTTSSTSAPKTSTPPTTTRSSSTNSSSDTAGGLPDVQQTAQLP